MFVAHLCRNRHLKKNTTGLKDNEGETIFTPSAQAEFLKELYSSIFRKDGRHAGAAALNPLCAQIAF